ncbi:DapH/DapD/GlmU-related protein [Cypionkella sp.]|uniref:acyltransferase n=1 Tax=Cypionkella sp. TaxID=2811411 RepID=UPI00271CFB91|nr:acyltransferase [Cypionkella sp.]MDO8982374.1 acyltransferase [Cypionkella sp.]MDP1576430.1 acyltransferase [Cypionkella sp.]MDP2050624.1 acyltransferase [Cypionkella sp.]
MFTLFRFQNLAARVLFRITVAPFFGSFGKRSAVLRPRGIEGIGRISIGNNVYIADGALLAAVPHTGVDRCELRIGDGCKFGAHNHIYATRSVIFEDEVLTAGNVYVSDNGHGYDLPDTPILRQPVQQLAPVRIGRGSWLGQNVCVIGASVGRGCVVGANSVVLSDLPDYCVAVGAPARVVRQFDAASGAWNRTGQPDAISALNEKG